MFAVYPMEKTGQAALDVHQQPAPRQGLGARLSPRPGPRRAGSPAAGKAPDRDQPVPERVKRALTRTAGSAPRRTAPGHADWRARRPSSRRRGTNPGCCGPTLGTNGHGIQRAVPPAWPRARPACRWSSDLPTQTGYDADHVPGSRRGRPGRRPGRALGRHARPVRRHPAGADQHLDDDQRHGHVAAGAVPDCRRGAGRGHRQADRHDAERHHQGVPLPRHVHSWPRSA